ncbi:MAG TPA: response regulator transcription factor [Vicinamibacterales bacterium]
MSGDPPVRVLVSVGQVRARADLCTRLSALPGIHLAGEAGVADETIEAIRESTPDVLLLDLHLPPAGAIDVLRRIRLVAATLPTVVLVPDGDAANVADLVTAGAHGVLSPDVPPPLLGRCIGCVHAGELWISREEVGLLAERLRMASSDEETRRKFAGLSPRELEIVAAVIRGETNRAIAEHLGLSPQTVKNHLSNIFEKLGVASRLELALTALHLVPAFSAAVRGDDAQKLAVPGTSDI